MAYELTITPNKDWLHATVTGQNTIGNVDGYIGEVSQACRDAGCGKLLIEERLEGPRLGTLDVFKVVSKRAEKSRGNFMTIAFVDVNAEGDLMDFAETVAKNRGSRMKVFSTVAEAEDWLSRSHDGASPAAGLGSEA